MNVICPVKETRTYFSDDNGESSDYTDNKDTY